MKTLTSCNCAPKCSCKGPCKCEDPHLISKLDLSALPINTSVRIEDDEGYVYHILLKRKNKNGEWITDITCINGPIEDHKDCCVACGSSQSELAIGEKLHISKDDKKKRTVQLKSIMVPQGFQVVVFDHINVSVSPKKALDFIWDLRHIQEYEPKVDRASVHVDSPKDGTYTVLEGHFAGIPWKGKFSYHLNKTGFRSEMIKGPQSAKVRGGFRIEEDGNGKCKIYHDESYEFSKWIRVFSWPLKWYLKKAMEKELSDVKRLIEKLEKAVKESL